MSDVQQHAAGRAAYEADVAARPTYPDGTPRKTWDELSDIARWSWTVGQVPLDRSVQ